MRKRVPEAFGRAARGGRTGHYRPPACHPSGRGAGADPGLDRCAMYGLAKGRQSGRESSRCGSIQRLLSMQPGFDGRRRRG
jgi:hypothetical protein